MEFQTLSHAGLRVRVGAVELVCDPWLTGSVYWRSWWNYPPVPKELVHSLKPDFIYLTHLHWDHFQAASLRLFSPDVPIMVPYDRYGRMLRDLKAIGRTNVRELRHGERVELAEGLAVTSFHFAPTITDSALMIEAEGQILLNANDAKFMGLPLKQILKRFPHIDFCFRSHSSANPRICYHYLDRDDAEVDDNERYLRAFSEFIGCVKPRYAIPFASNSCLLHDDVFAMNDLIQTPDTIRRFFENYASEQALDTKIQIMIPGDKWSNDSGFELRQHDYFEKRNAHLESYRSRIQPTLEKQSKLEDRVSVKLPLMEGFFKKVAKSAPWFLLHYLRGKKVLMVAKSGTAISGFAVDMAKGEVVEIQPERFDDFDMRIEFPALILRQSIMLNMFSHAGISKRVHYFATDAEMPTLKRFVGILDLMEAEILPLRNHFTQRAVRALLPRWRELFLYIRAAFDVARGFSLPDLEIRYLQAARRA